eukprot:NODE_78_length_2233_cov_215.353022_g57_i0.p1 GENE.NODE_78_length_2233_cov_215.353022_g57_i0~~NODE_78_length_2233_cov_215.353022_g57_i0.p1  ORF type:complete len:581 (-),score=104.95 NODE_78_length_2233_cov_215.353022_g57_i0:390-2132(-)
MTTPMSSQPHPAAVAITPSPQHSLWPFHRRLAWSRHKRVEHPQPAAFQWNQSAQPVVPVQKKRSGKFCRADYVTDSRAQAASPVCRPGVPALAHGSTPPALAQSSTPSHQTPNPSLMQQHVTKEHERLWQQWHERQRAQQEHCSRQSSRRPFEARRRNLAAELGPSWLRRHFCTVPGIVGFLSSLVLRHPVELHVNRKTVLKDVVSTIGPTAVSASALNQLRHGFLYVKFASDSGSGDEPAVDIGGPSKELLDVFCDALRSEGYFVPFPDADSPYCYPPYMPARPTEGLAARQLSASEEEVYWTAGRLFALSLTWQLVFRDNMFIKLRLLPTVYRLLMGTLPDYQELQRVDPELGAHLGAMLRAPNAADLGLTFEASVRDAQGGNHAVELIPGWADVAVVDSNKADFVGRLAFFKLYRSVNRSLIAFCRGFWEVIPQKHVQTLRVEELDRLLHGEPHIDVDQWIVHTVYGAEFAVLGAAHPVIRSFWEVVREMPQDQLRHLLKFVTGTEVLPAGGFGEMKMPFAIFSLERIDLSPTDPTLCLPTASTCSSTLHLPLYPTKDMLQNKLLLAIGNCEGFGLL